MEIKGNGKQGAQERRRKYQNEYYKENVVQFNVKLSKKSDRDILRKLDAVGNKQGYIKQLIRADVKDAEARRNNAK